MKKQVDEWEIIEKQKVFQGKIGNLMFGKTIYFKIEYIIRNKKTGEIKRI